MSFCITDFSRQTALSQSTP